MLYCLFIKCLHLQSHSKGEKKEEEEYKNKPNRLNLCFETINIRLTNRLSSSK